MEMLELNSQNSSCQNCHCELNAPFIVCAVCNVNICPTCFAHAAEFFEHKNNHAYFIFNDQFELFPNSRWTAKEELKLLDVLLEYGNFDIAARHLPNYSLKQIKEHYNTFYLQRKESKLLPFFQKVNRPDPVPATPYLFKLNDIDNPPRYTPNSLGYHSMAGYNSARSDFELEYDSNAEDLVCNLKLFPPTDPDFETMSSLQYAITQSYNRRLWEREKRKAIIRNHGLIVLRKMVGWLHRYDMTITKRVYEKLCKFLKFFTGMQFEFLMEGLHRSGQLKIEIIRLCDYHKKGITTLPGAHLHLRLKQAHEHSFHDVKAFQSNAQFNWKRKYAFASSLVLPNAKKRGVFTPLEIIGLPGYEKLSAKEQQLCRNVRLVPLSYIEFRDILINENRKCGYLKLQTARRLLKIDVNKTRRLYDFLLQEGYISSK